MTSAWAALPLALFAFPGGALPAQLPPAPDDGRIELERRVLAVVRSAGPGVVNVNTRTRGFDWLRGWVDQEGSGSGFVYDRSGHVVTNHHVVDGADVLEVAFADGEVADARLVGADPSNDLAVLRVEGVEESRLVPLPLGDSDALEPGRFVVAIGHPFGLEQTLTTGVVSGLGRVIESPDRRFIGEIIQTDAAINQGNSGGPLLNLGGEVIGVNTAIISPTGASAGVGFAIPATTVERVVPHLIRRGRYPHPDLGVGVYEVGGGLARRFQRSGIEVRPGGGLMVESVANGGPAARAGVRGAGRVARIGGYRVPFGGDYLEAVDGEPVGTARDLVLLLETNYRVGDEVELTLWRAGDRLRVGATLADRDALRTRRRR